MSDVRKRLTALESKAGIGGERIDVIVRTFVRPGPNGAEDSECIGFVSPCGWRIDREAGEARDSFVKRACAAAPRGAGGMAVLQEVL